MSLNSCLIHGLCILFLKQPTGFVQKGKEKETATMTTTSSSSSKNDLNFGTTAMQEKYIRQQKSAYIEFYRRGSSIHRLTRARLFFTLYSYTQHEHTLSHSHTRWLHILQNGLRSLINSFCARHHAYTHTDKSIAHTYSGKSHWPYTVSE